MKFFGMGGFELVIILIIILIIFGPRQLPKLKKMFGKGAKNLREGIESGKSKIDEKFEEVETEKAEAAAVKAEEEKAAAEAAAAEAAATENAAPAATTTDKPSETTDPADKADE